MYVSASEVYIPATDKRKHKWPTSQTEHIERLLEEAKGKIMAEANSADELDLQSLTQLASQYVHTKPQPQSQLPSISAWQQIIAVPGMIWISSILAIAFGILSVYPKESAALADIAKVFAGAIVGAIGAAPRK